MVTDRGEKADDQPQNGHRYITHDQADKHAPYLFKKSHLAVPQDHSIAEPADEEAEPEDLHGRAVGRQVSDGMQWPPNEMIIASYQKSHDPDSDHGENHAPALRFFGVIEQIGK